MSATLPSPQSNLTTVHRNIVGYLYSLANAATYSNITPPSIAVQGGGDPSPGSILTGTPGTWSGSPLLTYQWKRNGSDIVGQTNPSSYTVVGDDAGADITLLEIPNGNTASGVSSNTINIPEGPVNTVAPVISGDAAPGATLSGTTGTWTGTGTINYGYQWYRLKDTVLSAIVGATSDEYVLTFDDLNSVISLVVTATDDDGSTDATSNELTIPYGDYRTDLKSWSSDPLWVYSMENPFLSKPDYLTILSGPNWVPATFKGVNFLTGFNVGSDGNQNIVYLSDYAMIAGSPLPTIDGVAVTAVAADQTLVMCNGNSMTAGFALPAADAYPAQLLASLDPSFGWVKNISTGGFSTQDLINQGATVDSFAGVYENSTYVGWEITNDMFYQITVDMETDPATIAAAALSRWETLISDRRSGGYDNILTLNVPDRTGDMTGPQAAIFASARAIVNPALAANAGSIYGDTIVDVSTLLGSSSPIPNTNFLDGVHPTAVGYTIVKNAVESNL